MYVAFPIIAYTGSGQALDTGHPVPKSVQTNKYIGILNAFGINTIIYLFFLN
jgi:hypothetical protein